MNKPIYLFKKYVVAQMLSDQTSSFAPNRETTGPYPNPVEMI